MLILTIITFLTLCTYTNFTRIIPKPGRMIELSINNKNLESEYTFNFYLERDSLNGYDLHIKFPLGDYPATAIPANAECQAVLKSENNKALNCKTNSERVFVIGVNNLANGREYLHSVTIKTIKIPPATTFANQIKNPNTLTQGTGLFSLKIMKGELNEFDINERFGQVAFAASSTGLAVATSLLANDGPNELGQYRVVATIGSALPIKSKISVSVPSLLKFDKDTVGVTYNGASPTLEFFPDDNIINILDVNDGASTATIELTNILNHEYSSSPGDWGVKVWANGTHTITFSGAQTSPNVVIEKIPISSETLRKTNFGQTGYSLTAGDIVDYELTFRTSNSLRDDCMIKVNLPAGYTVSRCWLIENGIDLSKTQMISCTIGAGPILTYTNLKAIYKRTQVTLGFRATNPVATGTTGAFSIETYYNSAMPNLVDKTDDFTFNILADPTLMPVFTVNNGLTMRSSGFVNIELTFRTSVGYSGANALTLKIILNKEFTIGGTGPTCVLKANGATVSTAACPYAVNSNQQIVITITNAGTFATGVDHGLTISSSDPNGLISPDYANEYEIEGLLTGGSSGNEHRTTYVTIIENAFDSSLIKIQPFTRDFNHVTVYDFEVYLPIFLEKGEWVTKSNYARTYFEISFPTSSGGNNLFKIDLGSGKNTGDDIPCYGIILLNKFEDENDNELTCTLTKAASVSVANFAKIRMEGYDPISKEKLIKFHLPKIINPEAEGASATIKIDVYRIYHQKTTLILTGQKTTQVTVPYDIYDNHNNFNGVLGVSTNDSPDFFPKNIFKQSYMEIKFTPNRELAVGGGLMLFVPSLPTIDPVSYLLPSQYNLSCLASGVSVNCYSYRKADILIFTDMPKTIAKDDEAIFRVDGFVNPPYVIDLHASMLLWTFTPDFKEYEQVKYTNLPPFEYGEVHSSYVLPYRYQALHTEVTYDWVFVTSNDLPEGGKFVLYFPANYYDLESTTPCPTIELIEGVEWIDPSNNPNIKRTSCSETFSSSITTVSEIKPVKAGTEIVIRIKGVKNPSSSGWTPYFQIETKNKENYILDRILTINQVYITRKLDVSNIIFNHFYVTPTNGKLRADIHLSFYPQTTIPEDGYIEILLPSAEYENPAQFPAKKFCRTSGSLQTIKSCVYNTAEATIKITLDEKLIVEPGMDPVEVILPHVTNFNPELTSSIVKINTWYDELVLDESGSDETNRKAVTTKIAAALTISSFDFTPKNQGSVATYKWTLSVKKEAANGIVKIEFPYEYTRGLGDHLICKSSELEISSKDTVRCSVENWVLNFTNTKGWTGCTDSSPCTINLEIYGIVNPSPSVALTDQISIYLFENDFHVTEYNYDSTGALTFTAAPAPLLQEWYTINNKFSREISNTGHSITTTAAGITTSDIIRVYFKDEYLTPVISTTIEVRPVGNALSGSSVTTIMNNSLNIALAAADQYSLVPATYKTFMLFNLGNPYDNGDQYYPVFEFLDSGTKNSLAKTYENLVIEPPTVLAQNGKIIVVNEDKSIVVIPGTFTDAITVKTTTPHPSDVVIRPQSTYADLELQDFTLKAGEKETTFRIGHDLISRLRYAWITFTFVSGNSNFFAKIRPLRAIIEPSTTVPIQVTEFTSLPAGGRSLPLVVFLEKGSYHQLTIGIFQLGKKPDRLGIYPPSLVFQPGEKKKYFWISTDHASKGAEGSVLFTMVGSTRDVYNFPEREKKFYVYEGRTEPPVILVQKIRGPYRNKSITVEIKTDTHCTIYFAVVPRGTMNVTFSEIRNKKLKYDNFQGKYKFGEWVEPSSDYSNFFVIPDIEDGVEQVLKIFVENTDGILADVINYYFNTIIDDAPMKVYIQCNQGADKAGIISSVKSAISDASRVSETKPDETKWFIDVWSDEELNGNLTVPGVEVTDDRKGKLDGFRATRTNENTVDPSIAGYDQYTPNAGGEVIGKEATKEEIYESVIDENEKRVQYEKASDLGMSVEDYTGIETLIDRYREKTVFSLKPGQNYSSIIQVFTTIDLSGPYTNSTYYLPSTTNFEYIELYIEADSSGSGKRAREVWYQIEDAVSTIKSSKAEIVDFHSGSYYPMPARWSPITDIYLSYLDFEKVKFLGLAVAQPKSTVYYIVIPMERAQYDMNNTIDSKRIRYLADVTLDSICSEITSLNYLCISCDGSKMPITNNSNDIVSFERLFELPTSQQIIAGLDMNNYKVEIAGNVTIDTIDSYSSVEIKGLKSGVTYAAFFAIEAEIDGKVAHSLKNSTLQMTFTAPPVITVGFSLGFKILGLILSYAMITLTA